MKIILFFLTISFWINAHAVTICNHGKPQTLGIEQAPLLPGLPKLTTTIHKSAKTNLLKINNRLLKTELDQNTFSTPLKRKMKILLLSATNNDALEPTITLAIKVLRNFAIPFDHYYLIENGQKVRSLLDLEKDGVAQYYGIILSNGLLAYANQEGNFQSALSIDEWKRLNQFKLDYKVRLVSLYTYPRAELGVEYVPTKDNNKATGLIPSKEFLSFDDAYPKNLSLDLENSWVYPTKIINQDKAKAILSLTNHFFDETNNAIAAAITSPENTEKEMHFFFAQSQYFTPSIALSSGWIHWLTNGVYAGKRRIYLNVHIDDVFLSTGLFTGYDDESIDSYAPEKFVYRLSDDDLNLYHSQQAQEIRPLLNNPNYRIELAFNGNGIWEHGGYGRDTLLMMSQKHLTDFYWVTHTFTHGDLNWLSYKSSKWELTTNVLIADDFIKDQKEWFSPNAIVTPRISGFFNPGALRALDEVGIKYAVGDNTRKELLPPHIHRGLYTTKEFNGYDGIFIVPRYATEIYYNVSNPSELMAEYNFIYRKYFGRDLSTVEILNREKNRVVKQLLSYEYAPYMFHQANLRSFAWGEKRESLVGLWIKYVVNGLRDFTTLPILSDKLQNMAHIYLDRMSNEDCGAEVIQTLENNKVTELKVKTQKACPIWISGINSKIDGWEHQVYGPDTTLEKRFSSNQEIDYKVAQ